MSPDNNLALFLVTYNRKQKLQETLNAILSNTSPVKNCSLTILDNCSTDGTSEMLDQLATRYPNLKHIRHPHNIGGNANICRAFEMGASCRKEYFWVLCDDDKYDFFNWEEVEKSIDSRDDIICVCDYICDTAQKKRDPAHQIFQLTFVPAGIYKSSLITDEILINMYDAILTMFQQACVSIKCINEGKKIHVLSKPIVFNGLHFKDKVDEKSLSYTRGANAWHMERRSHTNWILGFANILTLLKDKKLQKQCLEIAIPYKDIYGNWENFYYCMQLSYFTKEDINYFLEIYKMLPKKRQTYFSHKFNISLSPQISKTGIPPANLLQQIFSVRNEGRHKVVRFLGIKAKFRRKKFNFNT